MSAKKKRPKAKAKKKLAAKGADRYALYLRSVQTPDIDARFLRRAYKKAYGERPRILREDFCAAGAVACAWTRFGADYVAYGVDIDPEPLGWGKKNLITKLRPGQQARVHFIEGDVRTAKTPKADVIAAENFSYCCFKTRDALRDYFTAARKHLADRGVLVCDLFGGYEAIEDSREESTDHGEFSYVWEQAKFNPITHDAIFHIHFRFADGSALEKAFSYEWRLWTIPEVRELMVEAGFSRADVYWEGTDRKTGEGTGVYAITEEGESDPAWNAYIVGVK